MVKINRRLLRRLARDASDQGSGQMGMSGSEMEQVLEVINDLETELDKVKNAIRLHRDQKSDDRCWLDDQKLYDILEEKLPNTTLPPRDIFLANCARYHESRQNKTEYCPVDAKLQDALDEISRLREQKLEVIKYLGCSTWADVLPAIKNIEDQIDGG